MRPRSQALPAKSEEGPGKTPAALAEADGDLHYKWRHSADSRREQPPPAYVALVQSVPSAERAIDSVALSTDSHADIQPKVQVRGKQENPCKCLPKLMAICNDTTLELVIDTGATLNFVNATFQSLLQQVTQVPPIAVKSVHNDNKTIDTKGLMSLEIGGYPYVFTFYVMPNLPMDALLGMEALTEAAWVLDLTRRFVYHTYHALPPMAWAPCQHTMTLAYTAKSTRLEPTTWKWVEVNLPQLHQTDAMLCLTPQCPEESPLFGVPITSATSHKACKVLICNPATSAVIVPADVPIASVETCEPIDIPSSEVQAFTASTSENPRAQQLQHQQELQAKIVKRHPKLEEVFDLSSAKALWDNRYVRELRRLLLSVPEVWQKMHVIGKTDKCTHKIDTGNSLPIAQPLRRIAWVERDKITEEINKMKSQDIIANSDSPWSSPPVLVKKKDGSVRFCIDYRKLNECTIADKYPLPRIDDVLDALNSGRYFSVIDLKAGYWQIPMNPGDEGKTAFRTTDGLYHFKVMPFGLKNAPATFQRLMDTVFSGLKWNGLLVYMDDIVIYSATPEQHLALLAEVLVRLRAAGLKINPAKTTLVRPEIKYLGHVISADGVKPDVAKIQAIKDLAAPTSVRDVRKFLGLTGYYRKFAPHYASVAAPLYALTKKDVKFCWSEAHEHAFQSLKSLLCSAPTLAYPRRERENIVDCDASDIAAGAIYMQRDDKGNEHVIQYISCTFNDVQRRWPSVEREAYAVVWAMTTFRPYLLGSHCTVRTDNSAAAAIKDAKQPKLQRWAVTLAEFSYTMEYRPASKQLHVDALSRLPVTGERGRDAPHTEIPEEATAFSIQVEPKETACNRLPYREPSREAGAPVFYARHLGATGIHKVQSTVVSTYSSKTAGQRSPSYGLREAQEAFSSQHVHPSLPRTDWRTAQEADEDYLLLRTHLLGSASRPEAAPAWFKLLSAQHRMRFTVDRQGNIIYRGFPPRDRPRWLVPCSLRKPIISAYHRGTHGAHLGATKLASQLALKFYWPAWVTTIKEFVKACERCQRAKAAPYIPKALRMLNRDSLWSTVAFDFFGPLPSTSRGNSYILVGVDHFSRWPEAVPTRVANSDVVAEFLHSRIIAQHGTPRELLSDHGTPFVSHVIATLCKRYSIRKLMSTPYTPQSNGIVERFMGYLKNSLITLCDNQPKRWDTYVSAILLAYRATPHPDTGETPFFLNKGYDPVLPQLRALDVPDVGHERGHWLHLLQTIRQELEQKVFAQQERIRTQINKQESVALQRNQLVLVKKTSRELQEAHTKLTDKFDHLARVERPLPNKVTYEITYLQSGQKDNVNRRNLKPFYEEIEDAEEVFEPPKYPALPLAIPKTTN